jgi:hypothetical protein
MGGGPDDRRASVAAIRLTSSLSCRSRAAFWSEATSESLPPLTAARAVASASAAVRSASSASTMTSTLPSSSFASTGSSKAAVLETTAA